MEKRLVRSKTNRVLAGVCGGLGQYLGIDPTIVRIGLVLITLAGGAGLLAYLVCFFVMPEED